MTTARRVKKKPEPVTTAQRLRSVLKACRDIMRKDKGLSGDVDRLPMLTWIMFLKFLDDMERVRSDEAALEGKPLHAVIDAPYRWRDWNPPNSAGDDGGLHNAMTGDALMAFVNQDEAIRPDGKRGAGLFSYLRALDGGGGLDRTDVIASVFRGTVNRMQSGYLLRDVLEKIGEIHFSSSDEVHTLSHLYESLLKEMRDAAGDSGEFYTPRPLVQMIVRAVDPQPGEVVLDPAAGTGGFLVETYEHMRPRANTIAEFDRLQQSTLYGIEAKPLPYLLCQMNLLLHGVESPQIDPLNALRFKLSEIGERERVDVIITNPPFGGEEEKGIQRNFPQDLQTSETAVLFLQLVMRKLHRQPPGRAAIIVPNTTLFYPSVAPRVRRHLLEEFRLRTVLRLPKGVFEPYTDIETNVLFFSAEGPSDDILYYQLRPPDERKQYTKTRPLEAAELAEFLELAAAHSADSPNAWLVRAEDVLSEPACSLDIHNPKEVVDTAEDPHAVLEKLTGGLSDVRSRLDSLSAAIAAIDRIVTGEAEWREVRLDDVLTRRKDVVDIHDDLTYKRLRIQVKGRGVLLRDEVLGDAIGTKRQFQVETGQFVLSKIDARNGAFGIVPEVCDGAVITGNFWAYDVEDDVMRSRLLHYLTFSDAFIRFCTVSSPGATNRRYLQENLFLDQVTRIPHRVSEQDELCDALDTIAGEVRTQENTLATLAKRIPVVLQSSLHTLFGAGVSEVT
jgi:type I restriction enzyme M protein